MPPDAILIDQEKLKKYIQKGVNKFGLQDMINIMFSIYNPKTVIDCFSNSFEKIKEQEQETFMRR